VIATPPAITVVAVHGNGGGGFRFERVRPHLPDGVRLVAVTLPGFADVPADPALTTLRGFAERLERLVDAEPRPRVLLGHGIGGSIALELGQRAPRCVDGFILHAPVGARLEARWFPRLMRLPGTRALGRRLFTARLLRGFWRARLFRHPVPASYLQRFFDEYRACAAFGRMFDLVTAEWFRGLKPIEAKTALLWGERDSVLGVDQAAAFRPLLPGALVSFPGRWGHFPMIDAPEAYARELAALARRLAG
jgi:pimeloyl-ACP methyl ester carboxylesterase